MIRSSTIRFQVQPLLTLVESLLKYPCFSRFIGRFNFKNPDKFESSCDYVHAVNHDTDSQSELALYHRKKSFLRNRFKSNSQPRSSSHENLSSEKKRGSSSFLRQLCSCFCPSGIVLNLGPTLRTYWRVLLKHLPIFTSYIPTLLKVHTRFYFSLLLLLFLP